METDQALQEWGDTVCIIGKMSNGNVRKSEKKSEKKID